MLDDFRNEYSFVDYKQFPNDMRHWDACRVSGPRDHQKSTDSIYVFLNYEKLGEFKDRKLANKMIQKLLDEAPANLDEFKDYLLQ